MFIDCLSNSSVIRIKGKLLGLNDARSLIAENNCLSFIKSMYTDKYDMQTIIHEQLSRSHCASIINHKRGHLVSYYTGPECTDEQRVVIEYWRDKKLASYKLPYKTGNSILIEKGINEAILIYSLFEDEDHDGNKPDDLIQRWAYCSNWIVHIKFKYGIILISEPERLDLPIGYLVRCAPIKINDTIFLPVYREYNCHGLILSSNDGYHWNSLGTIGSGWQNKNGRFGNGTLMQPTLWYDGNIIHSLSRDVGDKSRAWYSNSSDLGNNWDGPGQVDIWNANNSIVAINDNTSTPWLVWNHGPNRSKLVIGKWDPLTNTAKPRRQINSMYGSYPNYCWSDEQLHIIYTEYGVITRLVYDKEDLTELDKLNEIIENSGI